MTAHIELEATAGATAAFIKELLHQLAGAAVGRPDELARVQADATTATALLLEMDAGDKRITYVGGDYPVAWLREQVDAGHADLAVLIAPVTVDEFVAVNLARDKMPRKSTWFTPKARAGLVVAGIEV